MSGRQGCVRMICLLLCVVLTGCASQKNSRYEAQFFSLFDTVTTVAGYYPKGAKDRFSADAQLYRDRLERYHKLYDIYHEYDGVTNLASVNRLAGTAPVPVSQEIMDLLLFSKEVYHKTKGKVNIAFGAVTSLWQDARTAALQSPDKGYVPSEEQLRQANLHTDIDGLVLDIEQNTVFFRDPLLRLDVGAVAKGFASERALEETKTAGYRNILISVGGNVLAKGTKAGSGTPWSVGMQSPWNPENNLHVLGLADTCFVTSGDAQRYFTVDGVSYHHIIHPDTLMPEHFYRAVAVVSPHGADADALSTALFNASVDEGKEILSRFPDSEALWIFPDGSEEMTEGFAAIITDNSH